jgi:DNA-binding Xre family transcriptional regulator
MDAYEARTGIRVTYAELSEATGLSLAAIQSIGSRGYYNATLSVVAALATTLQVGPGELLEWAPSNVLDSAGQSP